MSETKVPPGWVRLTEIERGTVLVRASSVTTAQACASDDLAWTRVTGQAYDEFDVAESPAEVAALIAAAEAAERRARALPVMAAVLAYFQREDDVWGPDAAVRDAESLLAAIERREREATDG